VRKRLKEKQLDENFDLQECVKSAEGFENKVVAGARLQCTWNRRMREIQVG
jgi:hypothetical protein